MRPIENNLTRLSGATPKVTATPPVAAARTLADGRHASGTSDVAVARSHTAQAGHPPVDTERVEQIRKAVESGDYPLVPAKIADAIIAASLILRNGQ